MVKPSVAAALLLTVPLGQVHGAAKLAGNEDYAMRARASLSAPKIKRRTSPSFDPESISFELNDKSYLSPVGAAFKTYTVGAEWGLDSVAGQSMLVTVFDVAGEVTCDTLGDKVAEYGSADDVWEEGFMTAVMLTTNSSFHVAAEVAGCVSGWGGSLIVKSGAATSDVSDIGLALVQSAAVPPGPYLASFTSSQVKLSEVYRVYTDDAQAFTTAVVHTTGDAFVDLTTPVVGLNTLSIPVPSRLYTKYLASPRPLEGRRIAIKDLFDIQGTKTAGGSRAYFDTYDVKTANSVPVQRIVDQGGIIVGRAKTSQFANGESATADWVDQMQPFNPRGDGYQQTSSSSAGPGAAQAAYAWLDHTVGSDTGGSVIDPSIQQGVFGMRPTWGAIDLTGVIPMQPTQDTAGFFARDAVAGASFARAWYGDKFGNYTSWPKELIFPSSSWAFSNSAPYASQFQAFRDGLTSLIAPTSISNKSFEAYWNQTGRYDTYGPTATYLNTTYLSLIGWAQYSEFGLPWIEDYQSTHDGRVPFLDPSPGARWAWVRDNGGATLFNESLAQKQVFEDFVTTEVLVTDQDTCSGAIYVDVAGTGTTSYRNIYTSGPGLPFGFGGLEAQFGGLPELVVPIGQVEYNSTITNHTEYLPLTVALYAAQGCDYVLWDVAAALQEAGTIAPVAAGSLAYPDRV